MNKKTYQWGLKAITQHLDIIMAGVILFVVILFIVPLPSWVLDICLTFNITLSILVLLVAVFSKHVLDFAAFPTFLLLATVLRLALNVSSTRLILLTGDPGSVVVAFGEFVTQGDLVVGFVIFIIIVLVQFIVITNGSGRVAEVSARFTLDALPGKQMAIDNDLNTGAIDAQEARIRRERVQLESDFYGAMDGASKFVKGDAIAGIIVVLINFVGGIAIFMGKGYDAMTALEQLGTLTIGDGLVSQIPALLISVASGILVTRTPSQNNVGEEIVHQLFSTSKVLGLLAGTLAIVGIVPGMPFLPFMLFAIMSGVGAYLLKEEEKNRKKPVAAAPRPVVEDTPQMQMEKMAKQTQIRPLEIQVGASLVQWVSGKESQTIKRRMLEVRKRLARDWGILIPEAHITDDLNLQPYEYRVFIRDAEVGRGEIIPKHYFAMAIDDEPVQIEGIAGVEPTFKKEGRWINESLKGRAERMGYTAIGDLDMLTSHLNMVVTYHSSELVGYQELHLMLEALRTEQPKLVEAILDKTVTLTTLLKFVKALLKEYVPVRDLETILIALDEVVAKTADPEYILDYLRMKLSKQLVAGYLNEGGGLEIMNLHPEFEEALGKCVHKVGANYSALNLPQTLSAQLFREIQRGILEARKQRKEPVLFVSRPLRLALRELIEVTFPDLAVVSLGDVPKHVRFEVVTTLKGPEH